MERQRRTERRQRQVRRSNFAFKVVIFIQFIVMGFLAWQLHKSVASPSTPEATVPVEEAFDVVWTKNGPIYGYVLGDPDYGHEYIVTSTGDIIERDTN